MQWLWENLCDNITLNIWPPNFPDCYRLNYNVWGAFERETNKKTLFDTEDDLKARIAVTFIILNKEYVEKACKRFWSFRETMVEADGDFFE